MRRTVLALAAGALALTLVGCGSDEPKTNPSPTTSARLSSTAKVTITEPKPDAEIQGTSVRVMIVLDGGRIVPQVSTNLKPDEGHIHLLLDGRVVQYLGSLDETLKDIVKGQHLLQVEFVAADHGPFSPRVIAAVSFTAV